jgi:hypothetical protein
MRTIKNFIWSATRFLHLGGSMLQIHKKSALKLRGWLISFNKKKSVDINGNPIPWWTYSFIDFLQTRLNNTIRVLDYGSGSSTIWLGSRVKEVISIENYSTWAEEISKQTSPNVTVHCVKEITDFSAYLDSISGKFQIIIIDNLGNRMDCAFHSMQFLADNGVIIWDNTDGSDWDIINNFMKARGFKEISFTGMTAQEVCLSRTTVFYKEHNCLGI